MNAFTKNNGSVLETVSVEPQNITLYTPQILPCHGRACARCSKCRDWYWIPAANSYTAERKYYMKRPEATCTGSFGGCYDSRYNSDFCCGGGSYYHYFFACCFFGRHCECDDNRMQR